MFLIEMVMHRARELREFILLPWDEKKKRIKEYWHKYWRMYIILLLFALIIAFINVYIEWLSMNTSNYPRTRISQQSGGVGSKDNMPITDTSFSKKAEIRDRRLTNQSQQPTTSISDTLSGVGNTMSSALDGGVGKALSVIGIFFSAIIGLFLFCAAPVVIFYMWMKKLIMPLFPLRG